MKAGPRLIAVDGTNGRALLAAAMRMAPKKSAGGISRWDASGLFEQLIMNGDDLSAASPRLLLLLYAADLAFRLRWEIEPALAEGHQVVAVPYVDTAVAFGRACDLPVKWLKTLFTFARRPSERHLVGDAATRSRVASGFVEFGCAHLAHVDSGALATRTRKYLSARRGSAQRRRL